MSSRHRTVVRALALCTTASLTVGVSALIGAGPARADWAGTGSPFGAALATQIYDLSAQAEAVQSTMTDPAVPLGIPFSVGSYGASSLLSSNDVSSSDAGAPYSPLVSSLPSTGNGVAQSSFGYSLPVVPKFPGYVSARDPLLPVNRQNAGGYELVAIARPAASSGKVSIGGQAATSEQNNAFAWANSVADQKDVFTEGTAGVHALTLGGILDLANVSSYASLTRGADGRSVPETTTDLGTISFAGLNSGLTGRGSTVLGSAPTPISIDGLAALNAALKPAGITLIYVPQLYTYTDGTNSTGPAVDAKKDVSRLVSGALQLFFTNTSDRGTTTETITIGRVTLQATSSTVGTGTQTATAPAPAAAIGASPAATGPSDTGLADLRAPRRSIVPADATSGPGTAPAQVPTQTFVSAAAQRPIESAPSFQSFYLVVAAAAAAAALLAQLVRRRT
jgi:hypothetical protein